MAQLGVVCISGAQLSAAQLIVVHLSLARSSVARLSLCYFECEECEKLFSNVKDIAAALCMSAVTRKYEKKLRNFST